MQPQRLSMSASEIVAHLAATQVLELLPRLSLDALAQASRVVSLGKHQVVFMPGDAAALYVVARGRVAVLTRPDPESEVELFVRCPQEYFGEASLSYKQQINEARALQSAVVIRTPAEAVEGVLDHDAAALKAFADLAHRRVSEIAARLGEVMVHSVKKRLERMFERLANERGERGEVSLGPLTQEDLARTVGASRVAVNHALTQLRREGRIVVTNRRITVHGRIVPTA